MTFAKYKWLGIGLTAFSVAPGIPAANAMNGPEPIQVDGGPLGQLNVSGGVDGYGYVLSAANSEGNAPFTNKSNGANVGNAMIEVQKTSGPLQFTIEVGSSGGAFALGAMSPPQTSIDVFTTGPLYAGYVTLAPKDSPITISAGQLDSVEGWEAGIDWFNANQFTTAVWYVQNNQSRGVSVNYAKGPLNATVIYGDGYDTGVFNFLQALASYTFNENNILSVYYAGNLGTTGLNTYGYGGLTVRSYGAQFVNSQMLGAYYNLTIGNLNLVPEAQYQYAKENARVGIYKPTYNFAETVIADYSFDKTPYSLGAWVEYFTSHSSAENVNTSDWFIAPNAEGVGLSITPTWQYKGLFARVDAGYIYLLHNTDATGQRFGYGASGTDRSEFMGTLETGLLF